MIPFLNGVPPAVTRVGARQVLLILAAITSPAPTRSQLISKGIVWGPNHGDTAFTVPLFDEFMKRIIPGDGWEAA